MNSFVGAKITGYNINNEISEEENLLYSGRKIKLIIEKLSNQIKLSVGDTEKYFDKINIEELNSRALLIVYGNVKINIKNLANVSVFQFNSSEISVENVIDSKIVMMDSSRCNISNFKTGSSLNQRSFSISTLKNIDNYTQINLWEDSKVISTGDNHGSLIDHRCNIKFEDTCKIRWKELSEALNEFNSEKIQKAYSIAKTCHEGQYRDCGTPYICHPLNVAMIIASELNIKDEDIIVTALLHDVAEDTSFTLQNIEEEFGSEVANNVRYLTKPSNYFGNLGVQVEFYEEIRKAPVLVQTIKLADRLDNLRDLSWVNLGKIERQIISTKNKYLDWAKEYNPYIYNEMQNLLINYYKKINEIE